MKRACLLSMRGVALLLIGLASEMPGHAAERDSHLLTDKFWQLMCSDAKGAFIWWMPSFKPLYSHDSRRQTAEA